LYFRFYHKLLRDEGMVHSDEPATNLLCQGMVIAETFYRESSGGNREWINPADVEVIRDDKARITGAVLKSDGLPVEIGAVEKMSKSKNNGVDPQALINKFGADTARFYTMFTSPPTSTLEWSDASVEGSYNFLRKVWGFAFKFSRATCSEGIDRKVRYQIHLELRKANDDIERKKFNTVASACMKILNALEDLAEWDATSREGLSILLRLLSPIAPHVTHHLWRELGFGEDIMKAPWPEVDPKALDQDEIELVVQVNGKLRGSIRVPKQADKAAIETLAMANANVQKFVAGQNVKKVVVVPGRLVNLVI
jgi:leucyl-tRNA synthetase